MKSVAALTGLIAFVIAPAVVMPAFAGEDGSLAEAARRGRSAKIKDAALSSIDGSISFLRERLYTEGELAEIVLADPESSRAPAASMTLLC